MSDEEEKPSWSSKSSKFGLLWPLGVAATGVAGLGLLLVRGCWHRKMSWPVRAQGYTYQVCLSCGVKRLFDENRFRAHGPFRYDLNELIAWNQAQEEKSKQSPQVKRPAS